MQEYISQKMTPASSLKKFYHRTNIEKAWMALAIFIAIVTIVLNLLWIAERPFPSGWDEAGYLGEVAQDYSRFKNDGIVGYIHNILYVNRAIPPAHRLQAFPFIAVFGFSFQILRVVCFSFFLLSCYIIYLTTQNIASKSAAAFTAIIFLLSPKCLGPCTKFLTESNHYLAVTLLLYLISKSILAHDYSRKHWIPLGIVIGFGCWVKMSFLVIAVPSLGILLLLLAFYETERKKPVAFLIKSFLLGALIASPWWCLNFKAALGYAKYASNFSEHSLEIEGFEFFLRWLLVFAKSAFGLFSAGVILILLLSLFAGKKAASHKREKIIFLVFCCASSIPLIILQLLGDNHNMRLISPVFIPIMIMLGIAFSKSKFANTKFFFIVSVILLLSQLIFNTTGHYKKLYLDDYADWQKLRSLCIKQGVTNPNIAILGHSSILNPPQIRYPWAVKDEKVLVSRIWNHAQDFDWEKINKIIEDKNVIVTVYNMPLGPMEKLNIDNSRNNELIQRYSNEPDFYPPQSLEMGRYMPLDVKVFIRKNNSK